MNYISDIKKHISEKLYFKNEHSLNNVKDDCVYINHIINSKKNYRHEYYIIPNNVYNTITKSNLILDNLKYTIIERIKLFFHLPIYRTILYEYNIKNMELIVEDYNISKNFSNVIVKYSLLILNFLKQQQEVDEVNKRYRLVYIPFNFGNIKRTIKIKYKIYNNSKSELNVYHNLYKLFYNNHIEIIDFEYDNFIINDIDSLYNKFRNASNIFFSINYDLSYRLL
jgi:hypothetical protein